MANLLEITNHAAQFYIFCVCSTDYRVTFIQKFPCLRVIQFYLYFNAKRQTVPRFSQAYYVNKSKFCSFLRHASQLPKRSTARRAVSAGASGGVTNSSLRRSNSVSTTPIRIKYGALDRRGCNSAKDGAETTFGRSTTLTADILSTCGGRTLAEQETMDVHLASEESLSDESETLLHSKSPLVQLGMEDELPNNVDMDDEQTDRTDGTCYL